jgi:Protoglobin
MKNSAFSEYAAGPPQAADVPVRKPGQQVAAGYPAIRWHFGPGLHNSCKACLDQAWPDYQRTFALRHTPAEKETFKVVAAADHLPLRYMIAYISHIAASIKPFLSLKGHSAQKAETLHQTWSKAIFWPVVLGGGPYGNCNYH